MGDNQQDSLVSRVSTGLTSGGGPGGGSPALAFLSIAEMAAYDATALVKGTLATVLSLECPWFYDPTSTLVPDVSAGSPLGRTIVAAMGGGNWLRNRQFASLRWREQPNWFLDPANVAANDENPGTALLPLWSNDELMDRLEGPALASTFYDVTVASELLAAIVIDTRHRSGAFWLFYHGPLTPIAFGASPSGVVTAATDWDDATQVVGTISSADVPVSWTASGMVGKVVIETETGVAAWIMEDMGIVGGNPTARISQPQVGNFDWTPAVFTPGNHVQVYELLQFGTTVEVISNGGPGEQVDFQYLRLGDATAHSVEIKSGASLLDSCLVYGLDTWGSAVVQPSSCRMDLGCRAEQGAVVVVANGYSSGAGAEARADSEVELQRFASYGTIQAASMGKLSVIDASWVCSIHSGAGALATAWSVLPGGQLDAFSSISRLWGVGTITTAFVIQGQGRAIGSRTKLPVFAGAVTAAQIGNTTKTFAQLPYTNPLDQASFVLGDSLAAPGNLRVPLEGAYTSNAFIQGVAATPGWVVIDAFQYDDSSPLVASAVLTRILSATVIASTAALDVRVRLVRVTGGLLQIGILTFAAPVDAIEQYAQSADLSGSLVNGDIYQVQAECTGGATATDFATIRSAGVYAVITF